jgi:small-conductance mechanosensitive channel
MMENQHNASTSAKATVGTIIALYQKENRYLKEKINALEAKIDTLIDDKQQMLREERERIEQVYNTKDEQLKTILELIHTKLLLLKNEESEAPSTTVHEVDPADDDEESIDATWQHREFVELQRYLKHLDLSSADKKRIKKRFAGAYGSDVRIIQQNGAFYLDFSKYDYSDLLKH